MRPDDPNNGRVGTPLTPQRSLQPNPTNPDRDQPTAAVADIARRQIEHIYQGNTDTPTPQTTPLQQEQPAPAPAPNDNEADNPYDRTLEATSAHAVPAAQWQHYHSAWQDYYQKYYERYYVGQVYHTQKALMARAGQASAGADAAPAAPETLSRDEAIYDLRSKL